MITSSPQNEQHRSQSNSSDWLFVVLTLTLIACGILFVWFGIDGLVKAVEQLNG
ncbi:hypothetical protein [Plesiomonas shigelloides]|uniref:hypothetical protein n=1 Tax=Plesiomonas shigelloides TaxID=703 RepID=UPI0014827C56|nr:hypothetical protein [Plesiomonas shigelloides]